MHPSPTLLQTLTLTLILIISTVNSTGDERASLLQLRDTLISPSINLHSNWTGPSCYQGRSRWLGISCSPSSHVISIDLHSTQLTGSLSSSSFQNITYLSTIILANNSLNGTLPTLEGLFYLQSLSLAGNRFFGSIPKEYINLKSLTRLELQDNLLNGSIPPLDQPSLQVFNVSYNFLQGLIPETHALQRFNSSCFDHNLGLCGKPLDTLCPLAPSPSPSSSPSPSPSPSPSSLPSLAGKSSLETWILVCIAVGAVLVPLFVILCFLCFHKWCLKKKKEEEEEQGKTKLSSGEQEERELRYGTRGETRAKKIAELEFMDKEKQMTFDLDELLRASAEVMGRGQLGTTYKTTLESGSIVVVKRLIREINGGLSRKDFGQHMQVLAKLNHENVAQIIAFYFSMDEKILIFDHVPHGSLFQLLHENRGEGRVPLKWETRLNIVKGIARGLAYLHQSLPPPFKVPHGNLKTSNVLILHPNHHPKLTDYAFLPLLQTLNLTLIDKLAISKTPEYHKAKRNKMKKKMMMMLSSKADVFCFGLILIEVITGLIIPSDHGDDDHGGGDLSEWVRSVVSNEWSTDILDLEIVGENEKHEEMMKLVDIALECTCFDPEKRPLVHDLLCRIEDILPACSS